MADQFGSSSSSSLADALMAKHGMIDETVETGIATGSTVSLEETNGHHHDDNLADVPSIVGAGAVSSNGKFDIESLDAFPTLGSPSPSLGSTPGVSSSGKGAWGSTGGHHSTSSPSPRQSAVPIAARSSSITETLTLLNDEQAPRGGRRGALSEALSKVQKSTNTNIDSSTSKATGNTTFIIRGLSENVQRAKRELLKDLAIKSTKTIQIPASVRSAVIGPRGSTLRPIIEESGTTIDISKANDDDKNNNNNDDDDDEKTVNVTIEGDKNGISLAEKRILEIVSTRVKDITSKISNIDLKFYPFIRLEADKLVSGPGNNKVKVTIPSTSSSTSIVISGNRADVLEIRAKLESFISNELSNFISSFETVPEIKSRFISPEYVFENSGVSVITKSGDGTVELFGPGSKIAHAKKVLSKHVNDLGVLTLDISKAHDKTFKHARNLTRYFISTGKLSELEKNNVKISTPNLENLYAEDDSADTVPVVYEIVGNDNEAIKTVKKNLVTLVNTFPPGVFKVIDDLDPFFYGHVNKLSKDIKKDKYIDIIVDYSPKHKKPSSLKEVLLVYVGNPKQDEDFEFAPGPAEIQKTLDEVSAAFDYIRNKQADITSKAITVPHENHKFITGTNDSTLNLILKGRSPSETEPFVSLTLGVTSDGITKDKNSVFIRGLKDEVDRVAKEIFEVIEESKNYEVLSSYTTNFTFPVDHINKLIGKQGANLSKLTEEFAVKIDVDEQGNGLIKGIKKNADEAKARILNLGRKWADEVTVKLNIPNEHHATLIGQGGKFVKRLITRYDVHIQFPRSSPTDDDGSKPNSDRDGLGKDQVLIRGPSNNVAKARGEIEELVKYEIDHSFSQTIQVPSNTLPRIIGRQGEFINDIKESTNTRIDVKDNDDLSSSVGESVASKKDRLVSIEVVGTKTGVKTAVDKIQAIVNELVEQEIEVDPKYHGALIGPGGATRREIITKAGGSPETNRTLQIPPVNSNNPKIIVWGDRKVVEKIIKHIREIVDARENQRVDVIDVNPERHGALIGSGGLVKRDIESTFNVVLQIPSKGAKKSDGTPDGGIKIVGNNQANIDKAKARIQELTQDSYQVEVLVPKNLHGELVGKGTLIRKISSDFNVKIDHGRNSNLGSSIPPAPKEAFGDSIAASNDESASTGVLKYKFTVVPDGSNLVNSSNETISWRLRGQDENCAKAKEQIEKAIKDLQNHDSVGYFWLADSSRYGSLIGPQGSRINSIRNKSGCTIFIPPANSKDAIVSLKGSAQQLEQAKELIVKSLAGK